MIYPSGFKTRMIQRMAGPEGISASALSKEVGINQPTLSRWLRAARSLKGMGSKKDRGDAVGKSKTWSAEEKLRVIGEATQLTDEELGAFLRREGVHEVTLREWQVAAAAALAPTPKQTPPPEAMPKQILSQCLINDVRRIDADMFG